MANFFCNFFFQKFFFAKFFLVKVISEKKNFFAKKKNWGKKVCRKKFFCQNFSAIVFYQKSKFFSANFFNEKIFSQQNFFWWNFFFLIFFLKIKDGTDPERNLAREELDLPRSLGILLESGNKYSKEIVLALVKRDMKTRVEVTEKVKRYRLREVKSSCSGCTILAGSSVVNWTKLGLFVNYSTWNF